MRDENYDFVIQEQSKLIEHLRSELASARERISALNAESLQAIRSYNILRSKIVSALEDDEE